MGGIHLSEESPRGRRFPTSSATLVSLTQAKARRKIAHLLREKSTERGELMANNEKTSSKVATLASKVLSGEKKPTAAEAKTLAASVLTQAPDKKK